MLRRLWYPPILAYHRVHPDRSRQTPTIPPEAFERQISILARRWHPIPMDHLAQALERGETLPGRSVVVTFDDGTEDFHRYALPILLQNRVPATLFMIAGNIGRPGWLTEDDLRALPGQGVSVGSHTLHHDYLPSLPLDRAEESLSVSREILQRLVGPLQFLSYPAGGYTPEIIHAVRSLGYRAACTTNRGTSRSPANRWALRRIAMHGNARTRLGLWLRCSGYYGLNRRLRSPA